MKIRKEITKSELETFKLGEAEGKNCSGGEIYLLCGELGAGKTKFTQGLATGLGVKEKVNSPTFNILKIYSAVGRVKTLCHIDAYRLSSEKDLEALGAGEFFAAADTVTVIEWAEKVKKIWPSGARIVMLRSLDVEKREIIFSLNP